MKKLIYILILGFLITACSTNNDHSDMADFYKPVRGDYWATRYSYPTFQYQQNWFIEAKKTHLRNQQKPPSRKNNNKQSFQGLDPAGGKPKNVVTKIPHGKISLMIHRSMVAPLVICT